MAHLIKSNDKEEINRVLRLIQDAIATNAAVTPATPATLGNSFTPSTASTTPSTTYNLGPVTIYPLLCDSTGLLVTDSEGFLATNATVVAKFV